MWNLNLKQSKETRSNHSCGDNAIQGKKSENHTMQIEKAILCDRLEKKYSKGR